MHTEIHSKIRFPALRKPGDSTNHGNFLFARNQLLTLFRYKTGLFIVMVCLFCSCRVYQSITPFSPCVCIPQKYSGSEIQKNDRLICEWWTEFNIPELNEIVQKALSCNFELKQTWWRVAQACFQARIAAAGKWPTIDLNASVARFKNSSGGFEAFDFAGNEGTVTGFSAGNEPVNFYELSGTLNYEIDLWRRIDSEAKAACLEAYASREDLETIALLLTGTVVDLWFVIQEQLTLLKVINEQIELSKTLLELVEIRFSVGESSALDVYQQRLQLKTIESDKTPVLSKLQTSVNQLHVLLGEAPIEQCTAIPPIEISLPVKPDLGAPLDLLQNRPDLRAEQNRLMAEDYHIAAAVADLFPRLNFSFTYGFESTQIKDLFSSEMYSIILNLIQPIFDAGRRKAEVGRQKAILAEILARYTQKILTALQEVEDSLTQEKYLLEFIRQIEEEIELAKANLREAHYRYINGLNDYLTVIAAVQSLQGLQRSRVAQHTQLLVNRSKLYRSLGAPYLVSSDCQKSCLEP